MQLVAETVGEQSYGENNDKKNERGWGRSKIHSLFRLLSQTVSGSTNPVSGSA